MRVMMGIALGLVVSACGLIPGERPELEVSNGTTLVVVLTVNGQKVGEFRPDGASPEIDEFWLPPLPWNVEARTTKGRLLTSMVVQPGDISRTELDDGTVRISGGFARVDLSCGRLDIWAGFRPSGPAPGPGVPGDCEP